MFALSHPVWGPSSRMASGPSSRRACRSRQQPLSCQLVAAAPRFLPSHGGRRQSQQVSASRQKSKHKADAPLQQPPTPRDSSSSSNTSGGSSAPAPPSKGWPQRMASIQALMARMQQQLQGIGRLRGSNPALKAAAQQHLDLLMTLAEAEQRHITGDLPADELQQLLQALQQQLDVERQTLAGAAGSSGGASQQAASEPGSSSDRSELLGSAEALQQAVALASANLASRQQELASAGAQGPQQEPEQQEPGDAGAAGVSEPAGAPKGAAAIAEQLDSQLVEAQEQLRAAEQALADNEALRMDYDMMCQQAFELSRKLSLAEMSRAELSLELEDAKARLAAAGDELTEHRDLQMSYDKLCQDMYRLRMMLQQAQAHRQEVSDQAASAVNKHKQDLNWLMDAHRRELQEAHLKNQELTQDSQRLRMKLLELEQQLWGTGGSSAGAELAAAAAASAAEVLQLQDQAAQLVVEKQQLLKKLQDTQREQAVLLVELQQLREQQRQVTEQPSEAAKQQQELEAKLQQAEQARSDLVQQVQDLQQSLQQSRDAAAAAASARTMAVAPVAPAGGSDAAAIEAVQQLQEAKAEMVQLRGQLAVTRRELQEVSGRAAAAEAALQQQANEYEARLAQLQAWYGKQAAVVARLRRGKAPADGEVGFTNTIRFWVPQELLFEFVKHWVARESLLTVQPGFLGLQVLPVPGVSADGGVDVVVGCMWESIPAWEAWSKSDAGRQQHMPTGVYQYVPARGEGFPEDFVPFRDLDQAVNAKY